MLDTLFSSVNAGLAFLDLNYTILQINTPAAELVGMKPEGLIGRSIFEVFLIDRWQSVFEDVRKTGKPFVGIETPFTFSNNGSTQITYWNWSVQLLYTPSGGCEGFLVTAVDVTQSYLSQQALRESRALLEHIFESDPDGNILVNEAGEIIALNHQAELHFGYTRRELIGKRIETLVPYDVRSKHADLSDQFMRDPHQRPMGAGIVLQAVRKDGQTFPVEITLSPLKTEQGLLILAVVRDITERKRMEADLTEVQHRLIESIENERIRLAQDLHDGPIQDLYGVTYLLKSVDDHSLEAALGQTLDGARETVVEVINTLRDICTELRPAALIPFGLKRAIAAHAEHFQKTHPDIEVHPELLDDGKDMPELTLISLFRIYQHLISNVARHAKARHVWIHLFGEEEKIVLEVQDDGTGFPKPRRYVDLVRKGHFGLAGAEERAQAIGGWVEIQSEHGKGARVKVVVPRALPMVQTEADTLTYPSG